MANYIFPNIERLTVAPNTVFLWRGGSDGHETVISREPAMYTLTVPSEIVPCRLGVIAPNLAFLQVWRAHFMLSRYMRL